MPQLKGESELGSAMLEFIAFVLLGQLLVFVGSMAIASELANKVQLQVLAAQTARNIALERAISLPADVTLVRNACTARVICVSLSQGNQTVSAVSYQ